MSTTLKSLALMIILPASLAVFASPQLEALKDNWAGEKVGLPTTVAEWSEWKTKELDSLKTMVESAAKMKPTLSTKLVEGKRRDLAVVAIGGSGETLESIWWNQGRHFSELGFTVLLVENPPDDVARICLERGTSWLAYGTAALLPKIKALRGEYKGILWSGFSLGTELMMSTASLDNGPKDLFVYNDFLCRSKERLIVMNGEPNGLRNITPGYFTRRDFPERMLALSDHPILFTEGGLDRDFRIVSSIFPEKVTIYHQPKFREVERFQGEELPRNLGLWEYFALCNVDPANHYYKIDLVKAWLKKLL